MCGIFVVFSANAEVQWDNIQKAVLGLREIENRGPDHASSLVEDNILFGHTRLSIQDTSSSGNQPIVSPSGRYILVFNGEIYNHLELRNKWISGKTFVSNSDSLTIVHLLDSLGIEKTLSQLSGMFGLAIYDRKERAITIARDRYGEKPIFYSQTDDSIYIYSDPRLINVFNRGVGLEDNAISIFLLTNNLPYPLCAYRGFSKLAPGSCAKFNLQDLHKGEGKQPVVSFYQAYS